MSSSAAAGAPKVKPDEASKPAPAAPLTVPETLKYHLELIERSIASKDPSLVQRVLRYANHIRKHIRTAELLEFVSSNIGNGEAGAAARALLEAAAALEPAAPAPPAGTDDASPAQSSSSSSSAAAAAAASDAKAEKPAADADAKDVPKRKPVPLTADSAPERAMYIGLLVAGVAARLGMWEPAERHASDLVQAALQLSRRTLDPLAGRALQLMGLAAERNGHLPALQPMLLSIHRTASLRHDTCSQAVAINLVLRGMLLQRRYLPAARLIEHVEATLPLDSSAQLVRFLFAKGRVLSISADYPGADACLTQALRKAPASTGTGFKQLVQKHSIVVQLLRGIVPERVVFAGIAGSDGGDPDKRMAAALLPYLALTQAVRRGDVEAFTACMEAHRSQLEKDSTLPLVQRLRRTVIRSGLNKITRAYSAIGFADIASLLGLDSAMDAEFLCAKAISDGVIRAELDHDRGCLIASAAEDVYATARPKEEFHRRIEFCLDIHTDAVKAMRYPPGAFKKDEAALMEARQREDEEAAFAKAIEEHDVFGEEDEEDEDEMDM
ncbi:hypothetical protein FNF29_03533 [Cafeteria roenbergensis]|uniref:PCI domain-containing protein n=1 Tax=Cafeteria roenbergensis TaxID=33653 RepID=A0A5A8CIW9_CAFRO|nr:hypothetical protein FNF29_03533 [Cafeteria roenbergensis]|eukprot:KAA0153013.1 hypothetical protein FNF29_03533 [Cafeteria roenbergensis]